MNACDVAEYGEPDTGLEDIPHMTKSIATGLK
jgi:hypothetical protein